MSEQGPVRIERGDDGVATLRLDRPKVNAMSLELLVALRDAADVLIADPPGAVVVTGGERVFAAGAEISEFGGPEEARSIGAAFRDALGAVAAIPRFTIAAITGVALGGGCELALACDWRVCADNARLGQPEILLGIIPGGGGTQRLPRLIGPARAKEIILTGRQVRAEEALRIGLVDEVVPAADVHARAHDKALELATGAVVAQGLAKRAVDEGIETTLAWGLDREQALFEQVFTTEDSQVGVRSFLEQGPGKATFTGR
ncbi:MAG: enoyl-CoA hydratase/isomerase family protein [Actinomycetota bacterium]|nr:enoyl-CoA hydratase/isomerase family protein [Actinomycetota bacterium]